MLDADNLTVREKLTLEENLSGKSVSVERWLDDVFGFPKRCHCSAGRFACTAEPRVIASKSDLSFSGNFCDRNIASQEVSIVSEGCPADFRLTSDNPGVRISPSSGVTPATVRISVDPGELPKSKGHRDGEPQD